MHDLKRCPYSYPKYEGFRFAGFFHWRANIVTVILESPELQNFLKKGIWSSICEYKLHGSDCIRPSHKKQYFILKMLSVVNQRLQFVLQINAKAIVCLYVHVLVLMYFKDMYDLDNAYFPCAIIFEHNPWIISQIIFRLHLLITATTSF